MIHTALSAILLLLGEPASPWQAAGQEIPAPPAVEEENRRPLERAVSLAVGGDFEEALSIFSRLLREEPESAPLHYYAGLCLLHLKDLERSIAHLEEARGRRPGFPEVYYWLAQAYLADERREAAREAVREGLDRHPRNQKLLDLRKALRESGKDTAPSEHSEPDETGPDRF